VNLVGDALELARKKKLTTQFGGCGGGCDLRVHDKTSLKSSKFKVPGSKFQITACEWGFL
jgi:hypothetical protein